MLQKIRVETAFNAKLDEHLGCDRHRSSDNAKSRNGYSSKMLLTGDGTFDLDAARDRNGSFEPQFERKHQRRLTTMDDKFRSLYTKGMTTREIVAAFKEIYDTDVSPTLISRVTNAVIEQVINKSI